MLSSGKIESCSFTRPRRVAVEVEIEKMKFDPILLKRNVITFDDPDSFVSFTQLRDIYDGFVGSVSELHRFVMEQIRLHESKATAALN